MSPVRIALRRAETRRRPRTHPSILPCSQRQRNVPFGGSVSTQGGLPGADAVPPTAASSAWTSPIDTPDSHRDETQYRVHNERWMLRCVAARQVVREDREPVGPRRSSICRTESIAPPHASLADRVPPGIDPAPQSVEPFRSVGRMRCQVKGRTLIECPWPKDPWRHPCTSRWFRLSNAVAWKRSQEKGGTERPKLPGASRRGKKPFESLRTDNPIRQRAYDIL